jgi:hypothetical protein
MGFCPMGSSNSVAYLRKLMGEDGTGLSIGVMSHEG